MLLMYFSINFNFYIVNEIRTKQKYCALHALAISHFFRLQFYLSPNPSYTGKTSDIKKNSWKLQRKSVPAKKKNRPWLYFVVVLLNSVYCIGSKWHRHHIIACCSQKKCQNIIAVTKCICFHLPVHAVLHNIFALLMFYSLDVPM